MTKKKEITLQDLLENMQNMYTGVCSSIDMLTFRLNQVLEKTPENRESSKMEQDRFAEQRRWIGKLCKVYDDNDFVHYAVLEKISDNSYYCYGTPVGDYKHCEPVKPDDDIIYKGGDNE